VAALPFDQAATDKDKARIGVLEPGGDAQCRGLAAAGRTEQAEDVTALDIEADAIDRKARAEPARDAS